MKNACASESWPVTPVSSVRPIAAIAAAIANSPACSQNPCRYCGSHSISAMPARATTFLDTMDLPRAEEPRGPPQQDGEQQDVRHDVGHPAAQEDELILVARRQRLRDA